MDVVDRLIEISAGTSFAEMRTRLISSCRYLALTPDRVVVVTDPI